MIPYPLFPRARDVDIVIPLLLFVGWHSLHFSALKHGVEPTPDAKVVLADHIISFNFGARNFIPSPEPMSSA